MNLIKGIALTFGAVTIMAVAAACSDDSQPQIPETPAVSAAPVVQSISPGAVQSVAPVSSGSMIPRPGNVEDLIARSQIIVVGTLAEDFEEIMIGGYGPDGKASTDPEGAMAYTDYKVNIEEIIKGDDTVSAGTESFVFRMFGHINVQKAVPTSVLFKLPDPGDRLLFALGRNPDGTYGSGPEGLIDVESEAAVYEDGVPFSSGGTTAELLAQIRTAVSK
jgi:hypothetical protein